MYLIFEKYFFWFRKKFYLCISSDILSKFGKNMAKTWCFRSRTPLERADERAPVGCSARTPCRASGSLYLGTRASAERARERNVDPYK